MADRLLASDLSYECLQRRRRLGEVETPDVDSTNRRLYPSLGLCVLRGAEAAIVTAQITGEAEPLVHEFGDGARHGV